MTSYLFYDHILIQKRMEYLYLTKLIKKIIISGQIYHVNDILGGNVLFQYRIQLKLSNKEEYGSKEAEDLDHETLMVGGGEEQNNDC